MAFDMREEGFIAGLQEALKAEPLPGKRVLDYGCGNAEFGLWLAAESAEVTLLDCSAQAIGAGLSRARGAGVTRRVKGIVAHGTQLDMFADFAFDLVLLHGDTPWDVEEIARIMRPGARLVSYLEISDSQLARHFEAKCEWNASGGIHWPWQKKNCPIWTARRAR